jgi:hypothetical protein
MYKSRPTAFLFQSVVGALCIVSMSLSGPAWFATLAILGLRPFILKRVPIPQNNNIWEFYYNITKTTVVVTALTIIFIYIVFDLFSHSSPIRGNWLLIIVPYWIFIHGVIGLMFSLQRS